MSISSRAVRVGHQIRSGAGYAPVERLTGWAIILAPIVLLASSVVYWIEGDFNASELGGMLLVFAFCLFAVAFVGLTRPLESKAPMAAALLLVFGIVTAVVGAGHGVDTIWAAIADQPRLIDQATESRSLTAGAIALAPLGAAFPLVVIGLGVMYDRADLSPRWVAVLLIAAGVMFPVGRILNVGPVVLATDVLFLVAFGKIGLDVLTDGG